MSNVCCNSLERRATDEKDVTLGGDIVGSLTLTNTDLFVYFSI